MTQTNTDTDTDDEMSFEERLDRLDDVVERLEADDVGLDESLSLYEEGVRLLEECRSRLEDVETRVEAIGEADIQHESDDHN
ncbi:exodeoxyribonuclease VII small subunit [Halorutilales archaeon Cl-col2-1]